MAFVLDELRVSLEVEAVLLQVLLEEARVLLVDHEALRVEAPDAVFFRNPVAPIKVEEVELLLDLFLFHELRFKSFDLLIRLFY